MRKRLPLFASGVTGKASILTPDKISSNLIRWGDPRSFSIGVLSSYTDKSSSGNTFTASTTARPTVVNGGINGQRSLQWDGLANVMRCDSISTSLNGTDVPFTFGVVAQIIAIPIASTRSCLFILANQNNGDSIQPTHDLYYRPESWNIESDRRSATGTETNLQGFTIDANAHVVIYEFDGTNGYIYVDGTLVSQKSQTVGALSCNGFAYGCHSRSNVLDSFFNGYWGEDVVYQPNIGSSKIQQLQTYLASQWGLSAGNYAWTPYLEPLLTAWLRDDGFNEATNGSTITTWYNRQFTGGTSNDFTDNGTGGNTVVTNAQNGLTCSKLNGGSYWIQNALASVLSGNNTPFSICGAFKSGSVSGAGNFILFGGGNSGSGNPLYNIYIGSSGGLGNIYEPFHRDGSGNVQSPSGGVTDINFHKFQLIFDGTNVTLIIDGTTVINAQPFYTAAATVINTLSFGCMRNINGTNNQMPANSLLGEFQMYSGAIGATTIANNNTYLGRWGV